MEWVKKNKLAAFLIVVVAFLLFRNFFGYFSGLRLLNPSYSGVSKRTFDLAPAGELGVSGYIPPSPDYAPSESQERLVVEESSVSMVVAEVQKSLEKILDYAKGAGGFMVSSSLSRPEEAPYAQVVVRVPSDKLRETLEYFRGLAIRVTSENLIGTDVTDQYEDIGTKIATHEKIKAKFEEVLEKATQVQDILTVQRELINVQRQVDDLKGRQKYLEQTAKLAKITAYLSTDEWALPYTPNKPFRPSVIFKLAVRSLVLTLRGLAEKAIWIGVFVVIWGPILFAIILFRRWRKKKEIIQQQSSPGQ